ncbi:Uncharacterized protein Adt_31547 [Abeliophyllum distichum]|uniref:Uncharacterized protein n=1 Tax=Abeliophyllum distichum TaxID=126358 RepID=A0ABD1RFN7_9LAMI
MEFLVVDTRYAYHGVLGKPVLKDLQVATSIYHLAIKFPTPGGIAKVWGNQTEARECYMNALRKVVTREDATPSVMTIQIDAMDIDQENGEEDMVLNQGENHVLDLQIIGSDSLALLVEEL